MAGHKSKTVHFIKPQDNSDWYGALDEIFSEATRMPIEKFGYELVGKRYLNKGIDDIDPEFDASHRCISLNDFYAATFATFCVDDKERAIVTKQSAKRAFDAFHIGNRVLFNTFIYELLRDKDSVIRAFYGFMPEEEAQKLLEQPEQWLLRMDRDGFIITEAVSIAENGMALVRNYRIIYECGSFYMNGRTFAKLSDVTEVFPMELAYCSSPYFANCHSGHPSYYSDGGSTRYNSWKTLIEAINSQSSSDIPNFRCMMWALRVVGPLDTKFYIQRCTQAVCYSSTIREAIVALKQCLKLGAEMNISVKGVNGIASCIAKSYQKEGSVEDLREFLWSNGFDPNSVDYDGIPALWNMSSNRSWGHAIATIWTKHPDLDVNLGCRSGGHVLHWSPDTVPTSVLAHPKLNINVQDSRGHTILDDAITDRNSEAVAKFIRYGADAARTTSKSGSYLHLWIDTHNKSTDVPEINRIIQILLDNGVKVNAMDANGLTPLHFASQKGTIEIVKALLANGANINGHPDSETTPLHLAAERGDAEIVAYLLDKGADRTKRNSAGQLPKDVAALSAKELFDTDSTSLPQFSFKCKYLPIQGNKRQSVPFPRGYAQCFFVGEYLYIWGGAAWFLDWFDDYGYVSLVNQTEYTNTCWRTKISNTPLIWEEIRTSFIVQLDKWGRVTCAPVDGKIWFHNTKGETFAQLETTGNLDQWTFTAPTFTIPQYALKCQMFDFGDRLLYPQISSLGVYDKAKNIYNSFSVDSGDLDFKYLEYQHSITLARNSFWVKDKRTIFTMNLEKRRWLKSTTLPDTMDFVSFIVSFGDRFILALVREKINDEAKCKLMILDLDSGSRSFHDVEFDYKDYSMTEDHLYESLNERTIEAHRKNEPQQYETAKQKVLDDIANNNLPYDLISLAVRGTTLVLFGGALGDYMWLSSDVSKIDLSSLKPYLSLEQQAGIEASMNNTYSKEQLNAVPTTLRSSFSCGNDSTIMANYMTLMANFFKSDRPNSVT